MTLLTGNVWTFSNSDDSDSGYYWLNADDGAITILSTWHLFTYLSLIKHLHDAHYYFPYTDEETRAYLSA